MGCMRLQGYAKCRGRVDSYTIYIYTRPGTGSTISNPSVDDRTCATPKWPSIGLTKCLWQVVEAPDFTAPVTWLHSSHIHSTADAAADTYAS